MPRRKYPPIIERFWAKVHPDRSGCWNWMGNKNNWGYGMFWDNMKKITAHRWAFLRFVGAIPDGLVIMHSCDNQGCVNPGHMSLGTPKENTLDSYRRERNPIIKLNPAKVKEIRKTIEIQGLNEATLKELSSHYGVRPTTIYNIAAGRSWKWVA